MDNHLLKRLTRISMTFVLFFTPLFAFNGDTHQHTTKYGIEKVKESFGKNLEEFYNDEVTSILIEYCTKPDDDEIEGFFKFHFYNPATNKNFKGENKSALTMMSYHYNEALKNCINGSSNRIKTYDELGRALHFLEDLNTPVHTNNQSFMDSVSNLTFHVSFENRCKKIQDEVIVEKLTEKEYDYYLLNSIENIGKSCAGVANNNFYILYNNFSPKSEVAASSIINAERAVAGVLYKFYNQAILISNQLKQISHVKA